MLTVAIVSEFLDAYARIPRARQIASCRLADASIVSNKLAPAGTSRRIRLRRGN
jgi:hypothetical protein